MDTRIRLTALATALALAAPAAPAAEADLSHVPLSSASTAVVRPNVLFVLDDSGSMGWGFMPDELSGYQGRVSWYNRHCNTVYYNPFLTYVAPRRSDGTSFPDSSFTGASEDGYDGSASTVDLSTDFRAYDNTTSQGNGSDTAQPAYYYTFGGATPPAPLDADCRGSAPSKSNGFPHTTGDWTKVRVGATSGPGATDERVNFANWYSYYRTRMMAMKAAAGRAFAGLGQQYRVGFITINPNSPVSATKYLKIADFDAAHKSNWFDKLYQQGTNGSTPLRRALSRAGWVYGGKLDTDLTSGIPAADDPVQYSCQQNFTILTTDGYWNGSSPKRLDGTSVGNTDGNPALTPRPLFDNSFTSSTTTVTEERTYFYSNCWGSRKRIRYNRVRTTREQGFIGAELVSDTTTTSSSNNHFYSGCRRPPDPLPTPNPGTTVTVTNSGASGGSSDSLADVAAHYYDTDLRPTLENNVPATGTDAEADKATHQHMTTFTLALGLFGTLDFHSDYRSNTDPTSTFNRIRTGDLNWSDPADGNREKADDLWHTAVNGRGTAFVATNPDEIVSGLNEALSGVNARVASAAAAATSNLEPVAGDNFAYTASYETVNWVGEVQAREIDLATGIVGSTPVWSAQAKLDARASAACDTRTIYLYRQGAGGNLADFTLASDACDASGVPLGTPQTALSAGEQANFDSSEVLALSQYPAMTDGTGGTVDQRTAAEAANLVNFVRGQRGREGFEPNNLNLLYKDRTHVLGDIVNAQPVFVKAPFAQYTDSGYGAFKTANAGRAPMVYVAANDGMLHAFFAGASVSDPQGGEESWAFIPSIVLPELYRLADDNYATLHRFNVDGTPVVGDIYDPVAAAWRTILVGGLNNGGRGYYALDITDPANPVGLWEFKQSATCFNPLVPATHGADCNLGRSFGNPAISKLADGTWAVFVASGYNNVNGDAADGQGFLYVIDANTGLILKKIGTGAGDATTPSNLGKINNWVENGITDNTTSRVYAVDLLGNVWRFNVNTAPSLGGFAQLLGVAKDAGGARQPLSTKPELAYVGDPGDPFVFVATGRYLGATDVADTQVQSVYAIHDPLTATVPPQTTPIHADLRAALKGVTMQNTVVGGEQVRQVDPCTVNCSSLDGWVLDLPDTGERVNVDMRLQLGTLVFLSNVPQDSACNIGGYSWINFVDYASGTEVPATTPGMVGRKLADSLAVGLNIVRLPSGKTVAISSTSDAQQKTVDVPINAPALVGRRVGWRELFL